MELEMFVCFLFVFFCSRNFKFNSIRFDFVCFFFVVNTSYFFLDRLVVFFSFYFCWFPFSVLLGTSYPFLLFYFFFIFILGLSTPDDDVWAVSFFLSFFLSFLKTSVDSVSFTIEMASPLSTFLSWFIFGTQLFFVFCFFFHPLVWNAHRTGWRSTTGTSVEHLFVFFSNSNFKSST